MKNLDCFLEVRELYLWNGGPKWTTPCKLSLFYEKDLTKSGLESPGMALSAPDKSVMALIISVLLSGGAVSGPVIVSVRENEVCMMSGWDKIASIMPFIAGDYEMPCCSNTTSSEKGVKKVVYSQSTEGEKELFLMMKIHFVFVDTLTTEAQKTTIQAYFNGFGPMRP